MAPQSLEDLKHLIRTCPVIDNHGHNILVDHEIRTGNLLNVATEAGDQALEDTTSALSTIRALNQLTQLYGLQEDATWEQICEKRVELLNINKGDALLKKCFTGTQTVLFDDGLGNKADIHPYNWHDQFTRSPCKRIVRIEAVAADILSALHKQGNLPVGEAVNEEETCSLAWLTFITQFEQSILDCLSDPEVVGFKSVICYRTGLNIAPGKDTVVSEDGLQSFRKHYLPDAEARNFRVESKGMNDALVVSACKLITAHARRAVKPFQFHTGLGDNDINLLTSNPAYLQPLIKVFPYVFFVLLHSSYPYTCEAGYLATCYKNVYLDIGEVFPMVSRDGQEKIVRQALELTPVTKILWSTDGHSLPESYWLANVQGRQAIETVLFEYAEKGDLSVAQAMEAAKDILFRNSNLIYDLKLELPTESASAPSSTVINHDHQSPNSLPIKSYDLDILSAFQRQNGDVKYVIVQWLDMLGTIRARYLPMSSFLSLCKSGERISISSGNLGTTQNDNMTSVCNPVGQLFVEPDLKSIKMMQNTSKDPSSPLGYGSVPPTATVMARFTDESGVPLNMCPRSVLESLTASICEMSQVELLVGFEIEVTFCRRKPKQSEGHDPNPRDPFEPLDSNHAWCSWTDAEYTSMFPLILQISEALREMGIDIQQLHSEAGVGQYEFVLPPLPPVQAVDTLIQARQCIQQMTAVHGLRATFHPMPFPGIGTAAHAHISLNPSKTMGKQELETLNSSFAASILDNLPAICAFTLPQAISYKRVVDDCWAGGTWLAWGTQNREVPLRKIDGKVPRWEVRCLDGLANMYLALATILGAGLFGIQKGMKMTMKDLQVNPTWLSDSQKADYGITKRMPTGLAASLQALTEDDVLHDMLGPELVEHYLAMKESEQVMIFKMDDNEQREWLINRY